MNTNDAIIEAVIYRNKAYWLGMDVVCAGCGITTHGAIKTISAPNRWGNRMVQIQPATGFPIWRELGTCKPATQQWGTILKVQVFDDVEIVDLLDETYHGTVVNAFRSGAIVVNVEGDDEPLICNAAFVTEIKRGMAVS